MSNQGELQDVSCSKCKCSLNASTQAEVNYLKQRLLDRDITIVQLEAKMAHERPHIYSQGQLAKLRAVTDNWQDKYERLLEAHKRLQRVNQGLEDKLLRLVDRSESEKARMAQDASNLTTALTTAAQAINRLKTENKRYQSDLNLAIQLLQCNPSQYASHKLDMLPSELQEKVKSRMNFEQTKPPKSEAKVIRVPIPTFPPTAMVYSVNKSGEKEQEEEEEPVDLVSAAIMLAVLEEREKERSLKHCQTCTCKMNDKGTTPSNVINPFNQNNYSRLPNNSDNSAILKMADNSSVNFNFIDVGTQTVPSYIGETGKVTSTCIYCQSSKIVNGTDRSPNSSGSERGSNEELKCKISVPNKLGSQEFKDHTSNKDHASRRRLGSSRMNCSWDWHTESQDSGSPSTPTSLMSASLSYESETSCFTSPHDSPGHVSLNALSKPQSEFSCRLSDASNKVKGTFLEGCHSSDGSCNVSPKSSYNRESFTPPIHCTPSSRLKGKETVFDTLASQAESLPIIYSTSTWSATETSL